MALPAKITLTIKEIKLASLSTQPTTTATTLATTKTITAATLTAKNDHNNNWKYRYYDSDESTRNNSFIIQKRMYFF